MTTHKHPRSHERKDKRTGSVGVASNYTPSQDHVPLFEILEMVVQMESRELNALQHGSDPAPSKAAAVIDIASLLGRVVDESPRSTSPTPVDAVLRETPRAKPRGRAMQHLWRFW